MTIWIETSFALSTHQRVALLDDIVAENRAHVVKKLLLVIDNLKNPLSVLLGDSFITLSFTLVQDKGSTIWFFSLLGAFAKHAVLVSQWLIHTIKVLSYLMSVQILLTSTFQELGWWQKEQFLLLLSRANFNLCFNIFFFYLFGLFRWFCDWSTLSRHIFSFIFFNLSRADYHFGIPCCCRLCLIFCRFCICSFFRICLVLNLLELFKHVLIVQESMWKFIPKHIFFQIVPNSTLNDRITQNFMDWGPLLRIFLQAGSYDVFKSLRVAGWQIRVHRRTNTHSQLNQIAIVPRGT